MGDAGKNGETSEAHSYVELHQVVIPVRSVQHAKSDQATMFESLKVVDSLLSEHILTSAGLFFV